MLHILTNGRIVYFITSDISHLADLILPLNCISSDWFDFGLHLRVNYGILKAIEADNKKVAQCMREMLASWLNGQGGECTKQALERALLKLHQGLTSNT